jgi:hypothetical protein
MVVDGTFNRTVDWSLVAVEVLPAVVGDSPDIAVTPGSHDFGSEVAGSGTASHTFVVTNQGTADLNVISVVLTGPDAAEFSIDAGGGTFLLTPGQTRDVDVSFAPATVGSKQATLRLASNDPNESPFDVGLAGTGVASPTPDVAILPLSHDYGDVVEGSR